MRQHDERFQGPNAHNLRRICFLVVHRIVHEGELKPTLLNWEFLADFSKAYLKSHALEQLLHELWSRKQSQIEANLQKVKASLTMALDSDSPGAAEDTLGRLVLFLHASPEVSIYFMTGSDFLDSLTSAYRQASVTLRPKLVTTTYIGLLSLTKGKKPNHSLFFDHVYSLKSQAQSAQQAPVSSSSLLSDLVTNTPFLQKLRDAVTGKDAERARKLIDALSPFRSLSKSRPKRPIRRKIDKGKSPQKDEYGHGTFSGIHVHRMSLVTQIQDLFPDLGSAFITKLLDEYDDDTEQVTAHLLDDSLPPHLQSSDRTQQLPHSPPHSTFEETERLIPRSTPPPHRRNVFDDDELDRLAVDAS
ncbi:hypothetical protein LTR28_008029, partial [Elasticomyces elasticus]